MSGYHNIVKYSTASARTAPLCSPITACSGRDCLQGRSAHVERYGRGRSWLSLLAASGVGLGAPPPRPPNRSSRTRTHTRSRHSTVRPPRSPEQQRAPPRAFHPMMWRRVTRPGGQGFPSGRPAADLDRPLSARGHHRTSSRCFAAPSPANGGRRDSSTRPWVTSLQIGTVGPNGLDTSTGSMRAEVWCAQQTWAHEYGPRWRQPVRSNKVSVTVQDSSSQRLAHPAAA